MPKFEDSYILLSEQYLPSMKRKFPFESLFASDPVKIFSPSNEDIYLAKAGIDSLKPFLDSSIDLEKNYDLMGVAFNAFVVNRANKNDQIISTEVALSSVENFKFKPMNIEHKRKEVVGMITGYGFSEFGTDKPLTLEEVKNTKSPFNVVLSGFVWKVVDPEFSEKLESSSDPSSLTYLSISTSWEMGFKDFSIVKGGKNLIEAESIDDAEKIEELKSKLIHFGGAGEDEDGSKLYLNLVGEVLPLGIGFTMRPAADVLGVKVAGSQDNNSNIIEKENISNESVSSQTEENDVKSFTYLNTLENDDKIAASSSEEIKIKEKLNNEEKQKDMLIKSINDLTDDSLKQITAADVRDLFEEEIKKASEKFSAEKKEKESALAEIEKNKTDLLSQVESLEEANKKLKEELDEVKNIFAEKQKEEMFQNRMTSLDEEFNLDDEDRQVIGEQITDLDQESFEKWYKAFSVFAKSKNKKLNSNLENSSSIANVENNDKSSENKIEEASAAVANASVEKNENGIPNGGDMGEKTLREKFAAAFSNKNIKIDLAKY
jgi:hypothetical protein